MDTKEETTATAAAVAVHSKDSNKSREQSSLGFLGCKKWILQLHAKNFHSKNECTPNKYWFGDAIVVYWLTYSPSDRRGECSNLVWGNQPLLMAKAMHRTTVQ